ncbi:MAG: protein kinase [Myxococcales bacterium]|nr:protein kinase [Myxococcales bacterium]
MPGTTLPVAPDPFQGRTLGKYEVLCRLSTGGMSEIFLAFQRGLAGFRKLVVIKSILPDIKGEEEFVRMFLDEAKITAAFNHPNIAQVYDLDIDDGELFLAMEFVPGATLVEVARACRQNGEPIPPGFTLQAVRDTAVALHYAHTFTDPLGRKQTVIHRDVAEKNIMVTYDGVTKLLDFGIAKSMNRTGRTSIGMVKGTSGYMSPEQILGEPLDARSDVFSLGVVLHECLTGMRLFHGKNPEDGMMAALKETVAPPSRQNPEVTDEVDQMVLKALARQRTERYPTALDFARALDRVASMATWHPEQSGALVQRLFAERREQTHKLFEQAQKTGGEITSEFRLGQLLSDSAAPAPRRGGNGAAEPVETPSGEQSEPSDSPRRITPLISPTVAPLPAKARAEPPAEKVITETPTPREGRREITDPGASGPSTRSLRPGVLAGGAAASPSPVIPPPVPDEDEVDPDQRTIPAAALPDGLFGPPPKEEYAPEEPPRAGDRPAEEPSARDTMDDSESETRLIRKGGTDLVTTPGGDVTHTNTKVRRFNTAVSMIAGVGLALLVFGAGVVVLGLHRARTEEGPAEAEEEKKPLAEVSAPPAPAPAPLASAQPPPAPEAPKPAPPPAKPAEPPQKPKPAVAKALKRRPPKPPEPVEKARPQEKDSAAAERAWAEAAEAKKASGMLTLVTEPYAKVIFKSQDLGHTPLFKVSLPAGKHTLKLLGPDQKVFSLPVEIREGAVTAIRIPLSELSAE